MARSSVWRGLLLKEDIAICPIRDPSRREAVKPNPHHGLESFQAPSMCKLQVLKPEAEIEQDLTVKELGRLVGKAGVRDW